jgi:hypothetical protein
MDVRGMGERASLEVNVAPGRGREKEKMRLPEGSRTDLGRLRQ